MSTPLHSLADQLQEFLDRVQHETQIPGIAVALSVEGRRVYANAGTLAADESPSMTERAGFRLGCVMKFLLAISTLELCRNGDLDLNAPLAEYLAELRHSVHGETVQLAHLLSHTSGYHGIDILEAEARKLTWTSFVEYLRAAPQFFSPGSVFSYEHTEAVLLSEIVERVTGKRSSTVVRETLLEPLNIAPGARMHGGCIVSGLAGQHDLDPATGRFTPIAPRPPAPFWQAAFCNDALSLDDLVTIMEALMSSRSEDRGIDGPVSSRTLDLMRRPVVTLPPTAGGPLTELMPIAFGLGAATLRGGFLGNTGVTHGQCVGLRFDPGARITVAVGLNAQHPHLRDLILGVVCQTLTGRTPHPRPTSPFAFDFAELAGVYRGAGRNTVVVSPESGRLECCIGLRGSGPSVRADLTIDDERRLTVRSRTPHLSLGFFREPHNDSVALMLGLCAYKRVASQPE